MKWKRDTQYKRKKLRAMSRNLKKCGIMEEWSLDKTLLIEQSWVKSRGVILYWKIIGKRDIDSKKLFELDVKVDW